MKKIIFTIAILMAASAADVQACWGRYWNQYGIYTLQVDDKCYITGYQLVPNATLSNYTNFDKVINNEVYQLSDDGKWEKSGKAFANKIKDSFVVFSIPAAELQRNYFLKLQNGQDDYVRSMLRTQISNIDFEVDGNALHTTLKARQLTSFCFRVFIMATDFMGNEERSVFIEQNIKEPISAEPTYEYAKSDYNAVKDYRATLYNYADYKAVEFIVTDQRGNIVYRKTAFDNRSPTKLYPTMASNLLHIQTDLPNGAVRFTNINGAKAGEIYFEQSNAAMDISQLARGMYIANVFANNQLVYTTKIFKQ
jgi:hypothetical protein